MTAFEPFDGDSENASLEAVRRLADQWRHPDIELVATVLPVAFDRSGWMLNAAVEQVAPDAVIAVGEAGGRTAITPERFGVNEDDARIPDNDGEQPRGTRIDDGPVRRESGLPVEAMARAIRAVGFPASISDDAGRFVCNHIAYLVAALPMPGGFVHVPAVRSAGVAGVGAETDAIVEASATSLGFDDLAVALGAAIEAVADRLDTNSGSAAPSDELGRTARRSRS